MTTQYPIHVACRELMNALSDYQHALKCIAQQVADVIADEDLEDFEWARQLRRNVRRACEVGGSNADGTPSGWKSPVSEFYATLPAN